MATTSMKDMFAEHLGVKTEAPATTETASYEVPLQEYAADDAPQFQSTLEILFWLQQEYNAPKSEYSDYGEYNYRSLEPMLDGLKPLLKQVQSTILFDYEIQRPGNDGDRYYVVATATLLTPFGSVTAHGVAREQPSRKKSSEPQLTGASCSYAGKYALAALLAVSTGSIDPDAQEPSAEEIIAMVNYNPTDFKAECNVCGTTYEHFSSKEQLDGFTCACGASSWTITG